jgi:hypothetical protein
MEKGPAQLARKTKTEIIAEYEKLRQRLGETQQTVAEVHSSRGQEILAKSKEQSEEKVRQELTKMKEAAELSLAAVADAIWQELRYLEDLRSATNLMGKELATHYDIKVGADALDVLLAEYEQKRQHFTVHAAQQRLALEEELAAKRRDWEHQQEDLAYEAHKRQRREADTIKEEQERRDRDLAKREELLRQREEATATLQEQVNAFPDQLENKLQQREEEITRLVKQEADIVLRHAKQEWEAARQILELKISTLEGHVKQYQKEVEVLRDEATGANKRAQDLAVQIIKSGRSDSVNSEPPRRPVVT